MSHIVCRETTQESATVAARCRLSGETIDRANSIDNIDVRANIWRRHVLQCVVLVGLGLDSVSEVTSSLAALGGMPMRRDASRLSDQASVGQAEPAPETRAAGTQTHHRLLPPACGGRLKLNPINTPGVDHRLNESGAPS